MERTDEKKGQAGSAGLSQKLTGHLAPLFKDKKKFDPRGYQFSSILKFEYLSENQTKIKNI